MYPTVFLLLDCISCWMVPCAHCDVTGFKGTSKLFISASCLA